MKVFGGNPNDANQDGIDWLGGGDTTTKNSFFRASDDVFALQGNWDGYDLALVRIPGHDVPTSLSKSDCLYKHFKHHPRCMAAKDFQQRSLPHE